MNNIFAADQTHEKIRAFLSALGDCDYDIGVRRAGGGMQRKSFTAENIVENEKLVRFWKSANAAGGDIYVAPGRIIGHIGEASYSGIILVDDVAKSTVAEMRRQGYEPCAVVETSPSNFQAWVHISSKTFTRRQILPICRRLAQKFGGDLGAAQPGQFGRMPGFTNRKPEHRVLRPTGQYQYPFCRLYYAYQHGRDEQRRCSRAEELMGLMQQTKREVEEATMPSWKIADMPPRIVPPLNVPPRDRDADLHAQIALDKIIRALKAQYGAAYDFSRGDWMAITQLLRANHQPLSILKAICFSAESGLQGRKTNVPYYLRLTLENARAHVAEDRDDIPLLGDECWFFLENLYAPASQ